MQPHERFARTLRDQQLRVALSQEALGLACDLHPRPRSVGSNALSASRAFQPRRRSWSRFGTTAISAVAHLADEDPDQPEAASEQAQDGVEGEVDQAVALAGHVAPFEM